MKQKALRIRTAQLFVHIKNSTIICAAQEQHNYLCTSRTAQLFVQIICAAVYLQTTEGDEHVTIYLVKDVALKRLPKHLTSLEKSLEGLLAPRNA